MVESVDARGGFEKSVRRGKDVVIVYRSDEGEE